MGSAFKTAARFIHVAAFQAGKQQQKNNNNKMALETGVLLTRWTDFTVFLAASL